MTAQEHNENHLAVYENEFGRIMFHGKSISDCNKDELQSCICTLFASYTKLQERLGGQLYSGGKISEGRFIALRKRK